MKRPIMEVDGNSLSLSKIELFLRENPLVRLSKESEKKVKRARALIEKWVENEEVIYGVTTGFGEFSNVRISKEDLASLQENLILSHSVGTGEYLPPFIVKIMMLLRVNALAKGHSGIRLSTVNLLMDMMNNNIIPVVPSQGSVGSSGDLVQLSHLVLAMIGKGRVQVIEDVMSDGAKNEKIIPASKGLKKFGLEAVRLQAKEGLALINGTQMMTSFASYIAIQAKKLIKTADISAALTHEALRATDRAFDHKLHELRPYPGQIETAQNMLLLIKGSEIRKSHIAGDKRVQDAYSLRCIPQIHGASRDAINYVCSRVEIEINSANDNPLIFPEEEEHIEGGNFHGQPMALPMDFMSIALSELANVSERRIERMVNGALSGLPRFLATNGGLNSGLMIAQYTAASLVSENKVLSHPASVDSIPTSANQEDHNSMGSIAAQKCFRIMQNLQSVLAIELLTASQAIEFHKPLKCGMGTAIAYNEVRKVVPPMERDRVLYDDVQKVLSLIRSDTVLNSVEAKVKLN
ncbi:MAG: histidine ammonia-lyase [Ignavibacteria bacterium]|jgi:histidine ammonia-lyase|nr:histidine ammonia-lyase [Ignavibacteria bacterium]MCU7523831.1 histidine ammonia-lyase [Ignavibacteria bacterium]